MKSKTTSTAIKPAKIDLPAVQKSYAQEVADLGKRIKASNGSRITISQSKTFMLPDGTELDTFQGIILDFGFANYYYPKAFKRGDISPPACYAISATSDGLVPAEKSTDIQSESNCEGCWATEWRSKGNGKACQETRLIALITPDADETSPIYILKISPTGTKALDAYINSCARKFQRPPRGIITTFKFDENSEYATVRFVDPEPTPDGMMAVAEALLPKAKGLLLADPDYKVEE